MNLFGITLSASELIAALAIIASLITTIFTVVFAYLTNRSNIRAKQSEIAFEKRIEAFNEILSIMSPIPILAYKVTLEFEDWQNQGDEIIEVPEALKEMTSNLSTTATVLSIVYDKHRLYFPRHIDAKIKKFLYGFTKRDMNTPTQIIAIVKGEHKDIQAKLEKDIDDIVSEIQKYIGL